MAPDRKIFIGRLDTGEFAAAATAAPYFCIVADTEEEVRRLADAAAVFCANELPMKPVPSPSQTVTNLTPHKEITVTNLTPHKVIIKANQYGGPGTAPRGARPIIMTHAHYIKLDDVSDETLTSRGYELLPFWDHDFKHYVQRSTGEVHTVNKANPHLYIDDINNAWELGENTIRVPHQ